MQIVYRLLLISTFTVVACNRNEDPILPDNPTTQAQAKLLRSIEWDDNLISQFTYAEDSLLIARQDSRPPQSSTSHFEWQNKKLMEHYETTSLYTNHYHYNAAGQIQQIRTKYKEIGSDNGSSMDFTYANDGTVASLRYHIINEAGSKLVYRSEYIYANKRLQTIRTYSDQARLVFEFEIDAYSKPCFINPAIFISTALSPLYMLYNYPVLSQLTAFPGSIKQWEFSNITGERVLRREYKNQVTVDSNHIVQLVMTTSFPTNPELNTRTEAQFLY